MYGKRVGGSDKKNSEVDMSSIALIEAKGWADDLMNREFKGRGDKEYLVRYRLAKRIGISESALFRLQYKTRDMKEVAGSVYRALMLAYNEACEKNEAAADRYREERLGIRGQHEATDKEPAPATLGMATAKTQSKKA
jgi:hypothetical protein